MIEKLESFAIQEEAIRAMILNGSRVDEKVEGDIFQDYDVVCLTRDVAFYRENRQWIKRFGEIMIMQTPDGMGTNSTGEKTEKFTFLLQFADGQRLDITFFPVDSIHNIQHESLSKVILDKDGLLGELPPPSNKDYLTLPPSEKEFNDCCNEFWWVSTYIAKGLWRKELPYAKAMFDGPVRDMLVLMIRWHIGQKHNFSVDSGKCGKYFEKYLEAEVWNQFVKTYPDGDYETIWQALFEMGSLFRKLACELAVQFGFVYNEEEDTKVTAHLEHVRRLPSNAKIMYPDK
ncbi:aminoglycoside 6-adenylyltransferase [Fictibacillus sp. NE201]|uniref:Aminoglycoside 6-adenylyltransferase n=2 Tax=Fictibacillus fluitans TaxID=3058422 RepID=A0ABT8HYG3_9BACL|nr:aminoglycoside 6-adenylyltransferase [Fictibacillus sp. NE201]MDN4525820.1 aminoglycoside 6-adenylyltransferase [Fictibacillus sp. NE201]